MTMTEPVQYVKDVRTGRETVELRGAVDRAARVTAQRQTITVSAWMLQRGDVVNGRTVEFDPIYADASLKRVHVDYTDGTRETYPKHADIIVTLTD